MKLNKLTLAIILGLSLTACDNKAESTMSAEAAAEMAIKDAEIAILQEQLAASEGVVTADVANEEDPECSGYVDGICVAANPLPMETEEFTPPPTKRVVSKDVEDFLDFMNDMDWKGQRIKPTQVSGKHLDIYYAREDLRDAARSAVADQIDEKYLDDLQIIIYLMPGDNKNHFIASIEYEISKYTAETMGSITIRSNGEAITKVTPVDLGL